MQTRRALLAALGVGLAGCGTSRRPYDPGTVAPPPMDFEPVTPSTPTPRSSPLSVDPSFRWPEPYYNGANTCHVPTTGPRAEPNVQWEIWLEEVRDARYALIDGQWLYVFGDGRLAVLDRRTGGLNRTVSLPVEPRTAPVLAGEGFVTGVTTEDGEPGVALVGTVGELYWRRPGGNFAVPPAVDDDRAYVVGAEELVARELYDGDVAWRYTSHEGDSFETYPAVADGTVYVHGTRGSTDAIATETGERRWRTATERERAPSVAPTIGESVVVGGFEGVGNVAYDRESGDEVWRAESPVPVGSHAIAADGVLAASAQGRVAALSSANGDRRWGEPAGAGRPIVAGETVFVRGIRAESGPERVVALSLADGTRRWQRPASGDGWLLVADGYCYLNRGDGVIQCWG